MWVVRSAVALSALTIVVGAVPAIALPEAASGSACRVVNVTQDGTAGSDLQTAIDAARRGDTLRITGTCHGGFVVDKSLTLTGPAGRNRPTLGGSHSERVLTVTGSESKQITVTIKNLRIARGYVKGYGGGLRSAFADVHLKNTLVWRNEAGQGGGIYSRGRLTLLDSRSGRNHSNDAGGIHSQGRLRLRGHSLVDMNDAAWGAGIWAGGQVTLSGQSKVRDNQGSGSGGIVLGRAGASLRMKHRASIVGNYAPYGGGGIFALGSTSIVLNDHSSVRRNLAAEDGGGVFTMGRITLRDHALVAANVARAKGGGILAYDPVRLYDHACVERNLAQRGGGILFVGASLALRQHALITDNRAGVVGGGVLARVLRHATIRVGADAAIRGNSPQNVTVHKVDFVRPPEA